MDYLFALRATTRGLASGRLTVADCRLLVSVRLLETVARVAVVYVPLPTARRTLAKLRPLAIALSGNAPEHRVIWAVEAGSRWAGATTCLARALAAELLLPATGAPLVVTIGVTSPARGLLKSHAWVERDGRVLVGGDESRCEYEPFVAWLGGAA